MNPWGSHLSDLGGKKQSAEPWEQRGWGGGKAGVEREEGRREGRHSVATFLLFLVAVALIFNEAGAGWTSGAGHALQPALDELAQITPGAGTQSLAILRLWVLSARIPVNIMRHHIKSLLQWMRCFYLPYKPQSHPSCFSSSWKGFHICSIPQLSLADLSVHQTM